MPRSEPDSQPSTPLTGKEKDANERDAFLQTARDQGYVTHEQITDFIEVGDDDSDVGLIFEEFVADIRDLGIPVFASEPTEEDLLKGNDPTSVEDDLEVEQFNAALVAIDKNATGRTTDPLRMYMREMGSVGLLTREEEIDIARRLEAGISDELEALAYFPGVVEHILNAYEDVTDRNKLGELLVGYLDPLENVPKAKQIDANTPKPANQTNKKKGPDVAEAKKRFGKLRRVYRQAQKTIGSQSSWRSDKSVEALAAVADVFKFFKFTQVHHDHICDMAELSYKRVEQQRRDLQKLTKRSRMPSQIFEKAFAKNPSSSAWVKRHINANHDYSKRLAKYEVEIARAHRCIREEENDQAYATRILRRRSAPPKEKRFRIAHSKTTYKSIVEIHNRVKAGRTKRSLAKNNMVESESSTRDVDRQEIHQSRTALS